MLETRSYDQLQMRDISQAANLALATVYRYFPSKELLLARVFEQWCEGYWTRLARAADDVCTCSSVVANADDTPAADHRRRALDARHV